MLAIKVRAARSGDWAKLETLIAGISGYHGDKHALTRKQFDSLACGPDAPFTVLVAETEEGILAGYVAGYRMVEFVSGKTSFYIDNLFVAEEFRRQRIGEVLMLSIMQEAVKRFETSGFRIGAKDWNKGALALYQQLGFSENEGAKGTTRLMKEIA